MKKFICLRDDDTSFFTEPEDYVNGYGNFWGKVPVTLAVVPFSHGSQRKKVEIPDHLDNRNGILREWQKNATAEELTEFHRTYPIGGNIKLVEYLKSMIKDGMIEIAQHGVFHRYNERGPEMFSNEMAFEAIRDGKEYLEKVFEIPVSTFVPPSNTIDITCVSYLRRLNLNLFSSGAISKDNTKEPAYDISFRLHSVCNRLKGKKSEPARKNWGVWQFSSVTYNSLTTEEEVYQKVNKQLNETGFAGLGVHYFSLKDIKCAQAYQSILSRLSDDGVTFVTASEYFNKIVECFYE